MKAFYKRVQQITGANYFPLLASIMLIIAFLVGLYWRQGARAALCGPAGEQCFREWVSATGGWAAIVFAYMTIRTMNRQTKEANRHQRENVELQIFDRLSAARSVIRQCEKGQKTCRETEERIAAAIDKKDYGSIDPDSISILLRSCISEDAISSINSMQPFMPDIPDLTDHIHYFETVSVTLSKSIENANHHISEVALVSIVARLHVINELLELTKQNSQHFIDKWFGRIIDN